MYTLQNEITGETNGICYGTWDEASSESQNYGPEWFVIEL